MFPRLLPIFCFILLIAGQVAAFEVGAKIQKIDVEKRTAIVFANGQERIVKIADDVKVLDEVGKELTGGFSAVELKTDSIVTLQVERENNTVVIKSIRLGGSLKPQDTNPPSKASVGKSSVGFKPLTEMTTDDRYKGEDGGLYGGGRNDPPESHATQARSESAKIVPRDVNGNPATDGKIGLISISMSNATQEFSKFKQIADADPQKSADVIVVDCAQGGQTMARWADRDAGCWVEAGRRLQNAGIANEQVQVAWIKLANAGPKGDLHEHGKDLDRDTRTVLENLMGRFPNLRIAYLGSRIYGGYADGKLNPEPYAYEGAFVVRWLIQSQMAAEPALNCDPTKGKVKAPLLLWGPYLWSDGMTPRKSDGQVWERSDFATDGTHPSDSGRMKVAVQLLEFLKTDPHARTWFVKK
jgi:hypothetical protein